MTNDGDRLADDTRADELAADGNDVVDGVEPPTAEEQLEYLRDHGWLT